MFWTRKVEDRLTGCCQKIRCWFRKTKGAEVQGDFLVGKESLFRSCHCVIRATAYCNGKAGKKNQSMNDCFFSIEERVGRPV